MEFPTGRKTLAILLSFGKERVDLHLYQPSLFSTMCKDPGQIVSLTFPHYFFSRQYLEHWSSSCSSLHFFKKERTFCKSMGKSVQNPCSVCGKIRNKPYNQSTRLIFDLIKHNLHNLVSDILTSYCYYFGIRGKDFQNYAWSKYSIFLFSSCYLIGNNFFHLWSAVCPGGGRMGLGLCCNSYCYSYHHNFHW